MTDNMATLDELLVFCNKVREAGGGELIDALMPGDECDPHSCLIARNLNFDCFVNKTGGEPSSWFMAVPNEAVAEDISRKLDLPTTEVPNPWYDEDDEYVVAVKLPVSIGRVAEAFDNYELPEAYYTSAGEES